MAADGVHKLFKLKLQLQSGVGELGFGHKFLIILFLRCFTIISAVADIHILLGHLYFGVGGFIFISLIDKNVLTAVGEMLYYIHINSAKRSFGGYYGKRKAWKPFGLHIA